MRNAQTLLIAILNILSLSSILAGTQYEYYGCFKPSRKQITTSAPSIRKTTANRREVGSFNNKGGKNTAQFAYQYTSSNTRKFNLGAYISFSIFSAEAKAVLNGELQWTRTDSFKGTKEVPNNKVAHAIITDIVTTHTFKHTIQHQEKGLNEKVWKNTGTSTTSTSSVVTITPEFKIEIRDN